MMNNKGLTIVEIVISMVVISISVLSIVFSYQQALNNSVKTRSLTVGTGLAEDKIEEMLAREYSAVASETGSFSSPFADYSYSVDVYNVQSSDLDTSYGSETGYKRVDVTVAGGDGTTVELDTLITD